jgi:hypothetical protein
VPRSGHAVPLLLALSLLATGASAAGRAPTVTYRTPHFVLTTDSDPDTLSRVASRLEAFHDAMAVLVPAATGAALPELPIRVRLFEDAASYRAFAATHAPALADNGGYYDGATRTVVAHRRSNPLQLVLHEVVHAMLGDVFGDPDHLRYSRPAWPIWFDEGFAEYASSVRLHGRDLQVGALHAARLATLVDAARADAVPSIERLFATRAEDFSGPDKDLWYAAAWGVVDLLMAEPDLRGALPQWIGRLRDDAPTAAFAAVFGRDLDRRLRLRIGRLAAAAPRPLALIQDADLDAWTVHGQGQWRQRGDVLRGAGDAAAWHYLTRPVVPVRAFELELEIRRAGDTSVGLVLGHHRAGAYPYHTQIDLRPDRTAVRSVLAVGQLEPLAGAGPLLSPGRWATVQVAQRAGVLSLWVDGVIALSVPAPEPTLSLLGLYVQGGAAEFRRFALAPAAGFAAGPAEPPPPSLE